MTQHSSDPNTGTSVMALDGITIIDLTRALAGPYCTMMLADMGARVIKIEPPGKGDETRGWGPPFVNGESSYFMSVNRNKESVTLDIRTEGGRNALNALLAHADVLVENFRPGTLARFGFGYEDVRQRHPRVIYTSISGFGQTGPLRLRAGYDAVAQAEGGLMSVTGDAGGPPFRLGVAIADITAGMFAAQGITLALLARARTGKGQLVDVGLLDSVAALLTYQAGSYLTTGQAPRRLGNRHPMIVPYETFDASDGVLIVAVGNDDQWQRFCKVTGLNDLGADPRFIANRDRVAAYDELVPRVAVRLRERTRDEWIAALTEAGVPCGAVRDIGEVLRDPQLLAREMVVDLQHPTVGPLRVLGTPIKLSDTPGGVRTPPPRLGEHTRAVLTELAGLDKAALDRLAADGVV